MHIRSQKDYQSINKVNFCYFCGGPLDNGEELNYDHCPPKRIFHVSDRTDYPIKIRVHKKCNHNWHLEDDKLSVFFDELHGGKKSSNQKHVRKLDFIELVNSEGTYQGLGLTNFPLAPLTYRIIKCAHAILYGEYLSKNTFNRVYYPWWELDSNSQQIIETSSLTYDLSNRLCTAQKTDSYDSIYAYNKKFKFVSTWTKSDEGIDICIFAFDIYKLSIFSVEKEGFPKAIIGCYAVRKPSNASKSSGLLVDNSDSEILYPILG